MGQSGVGNLCSMEGERVQQRQLAEVNKPGIGDSGAVEGHGVEVLQSLYAMISLIGFADGSAMRIGRPTFEVFWVIGSTPSARQAVARKSLTATGRSATVIPSSLLFPT